MSEQRKSKDQKKRNKSEAIKVPQDLVSEKSVEKNYKVLGKVDMYLLEKCVLCRKLIISRISRLLDITSNFGQSRPFLSTIHLV